MAVVFISPKQRQKMFLMAISVALVLFLALATLGISLSRPEGNQVPVVFNKPKVSIDFKILDSEEFKSLEPFSKMELQFFYQAADGKGGETQGYISAFSLAEAIKILENMNLTVLNIQEAQIGRDNPFAPYYQQTTTPQPGE